MQRRVHLLLTITYVSFDQSAAKHVFPQKNQARRVWLGQLASVSVGRPDQPDRLVSQALNQLQHNAKPARALQRHEVTLHVRRRHAGLHGKRAQTKFTTRLRSTDKSLRICATRSQIHGQDSKGSVSGRRRRGAARRRRGRGRSDLLLPLKLLSLQIVDVVRPRL